MSLSRELLGELETKVMKVIWASDEAMSPRSVLSKLEEEYAYTTIMTILCTLTQKGLLTRKKIGKTFFYTVKESRSVFAKNRLSKHFDSLIDDFGDLALLQFVESLKDDPTAIEKLESYLHELNDNASKAKK